MPTESNVFRNAYNQCNWIFDFFAHGFDFLNGRFFPPVDGASYVALEEQTKEVVRQNLVDSVVRADGQIPIELRRYMRLPGDDGDLLSIDFCLRLYCALSVIDDAVADLNYLAFFVRALPNRWVRSREHIDRTHQLQQSAPGHLIFRPHDFEKAGRTWYTDTRSGGRWGALPTRGVDLSDFFQNLLRAERAADCFVDIDIASSALDIEMDPAELRIGIVPLVESLEVNADKARLLPGPLLLVREASSQPTFGIRIAPPIDPSSPCQELCERADAALRYLSNRGAQIVLFPEMVVPDPVLQRIRTVLFDLSDSRKPRPALVLAGSFSRMSPSGSSTAPFNVAVVLNGKGEELWRQKKLQPYEMKRHEQKRFGLEEILNSDSCREHMAFEPRLLRFVDSRRTGLRMVTLICEDATRAPGLKIAKELRANLILVPVMAGPLTNECGFATNLDPIVNEHDAVFIVANSGALARAAAKDPSDPPPLGIVGIPLTLAESGYRPHKLLKETTVVPGSVNPEVLYYQLPDVV